MTDPVRSEDDDLDGGGEPARRPINWDAVAAVIAALIGLLAVLVSTSVF
jgi:hypothetical protein